MNAMMIKPMKTKTTYEDHDVTENAPPSVARTYPAGEVCCIRGCGLYMASKGGADEATDFVRGGVYSGCARSVGVEFESVGHDERHC